MRKVLRNGRIEDESGTWAIVSDADPLREGVGARGAQRVVAWTGWYDEEAQPAIGAFARDCRVWLPGAWEALRVRIAEFGEGAGVLLRPHARHVVSDPQRCARLIGELPPGVGLLLDPVSMLEPEMLRDAEDHVARALEFAELCAGVVVGGAEMVGDGLRVVGGGTVLRRERVEEWVERRAAGAMRIVVEDR